MKRFAREYPVFEKWQPVVAKLSWSHNNVLLQKVKDEKERLWYAQKAVEYGRSKNVLTMQIEYGQYERSGEAITNFSDQLPSHQSDMAQQVFKDPYILDFLGLEEGFIEKEMEDAIEQHITRFLLELGQGFSFVGRQYHLGIG